MTDQPLSRRTRNVMNTAPFKRGDDYFINVYQRFAQSGAEIADFTFGNPHEMPIPAVVDAFERWLTPQDKNWFAYKQSEPPAQEVVAESLQKLLGMDFEPADIAMTNGGVAALSVALKVVSEPGDEVIYSLPPWHGNEPLAIEAGLVPVKVLADHESFDLDLDAIAAAITPRTRLVIVNSPNNPTGRIYPPQTLRQLANLLEEASARNDRRIYLLSDEPYNRIVFDGARFHSPLEYYPYSFMAYSYGKTLLIPGQRIGYLALPPTMPLADREQLCDGIRMLQAGSGYLFPNALLQHALGDLEGLTLDLDHLTRKRDRMVDTLSEMGYQVHRPEGTFYLFPKSPIPDDQAFIELLVEENVFVLPGNLFETPGYFRISLTANDEMIERGLPGFARAIQRARVPAA